MTPVKCLHFIFPALIFLLLPFSGLSQESDRKSVDEVYTGVYSIKDEQFGIWNGSNYVPVFIKGINLGISLPGTQPGNLAASREDYSRWFHLIKEAGYNTIRLYTLHFPRFYDELRKYNLENPQNPLLVMHGIWLEENESLKDLYEQSGEFGQEIREVVSAIHGDILIDHRFGKAYGDFNSDISPWVIGFLAGREIFPSEVALANENHPEEVNYEGRYLSLQNADPVEIWITRHLDSLMIYEYEQYKTLRPIGFSSWPTLDPLSHPTEQLIENSQEDDEKIDLSTMICADSCGGFFIGYHAYPYYPDFIVHDPPYNNESDSFGPNSYLGYLKDLKAHYQGIPLLIAEYGVPSSWGAGHFASSGMHHGALSEEETGHFAIRMLNNIKDAGCAGGVQFSLIDEWFKQTWITNPLSDRQYRHYWHNISSPEQNFGILSYAPPPEPFVETGSFPGQAISMVSVVGDYTFFRIRIHLNSEENLSDTLWIALDTYLANLGESLLPDGSSIGTGTDTLRAEFVLQVPIDGDMAKLFVIPGYDIYGGKTVNRVDTVTSVSTDMGVWNEVKWKIDYFYNRDQYVGRLKISEEDDPYEFLNAVSIYKDSMDIRIPWTLINFYAPTVMRNLHFLSHSEGNKIVIDQQDTLSDGIALTLSLDGDLYQTDRYTWSPWDHEKIANHPPIERKKQSFHILKELLPEFNTPPIGRADTFKLWPGNTLDIEEEEGILSNDFDIDGNSMQAILSFGNGTANGTLHLHPNGSFNYTPNPGFRGKDFFMYYLDDERAYSSLIPVFLDVNYPLKADRTDGMEDISIYPNPARERFCIRIPQGFGEAEVYLSDMLGRKIMNTELHEETTWIELEDLVSGVYFINLIKEYNIMQYRLIIH